MGIIHSSQSFFRAPSEWGSCSRTIRLEHASGGAVCYMVLMVLFTELMVLFMEHVQYLWLSCTLFMTNNTSRQARCVFNPGEALAIMYTIYEH